MNVQQEINDAIRRLCNSATREERMQAAADLKYFHSLRDPQTIRKMEQRIFKH